MFSCGIRLFSLSQLSPRRKAGAFFCRRRYTLTVPLSQTSQTMIVRPDWTASQDPENWLTEPEMALYHAWHSPKRRAEWLAGRLAAKRLVGETFELGPLTFAIGHEGVAPCILSSEIPLLTLSLSHSHGLGAATLSDSRQEGNAGIDAQHIRPVHHGLGARVFTMSERGQIAARFGAEDDPAGMLLFWALKEAAIKARRAVWGLPLREIEAQIISGDKAIVQMTGEPPLTAAFERLDGWWLARAVLPPG